MKKIIKIIIVTAIMLLMLISCDSKKEDTPVQETEIITYIVTSGFTDATGTYYSEFVTTIIEEVTTYTFGPETGTGPFETEWIPSNKSPQEQYYDEYISPLFQRAVNNTAKYDDIITKEFPLKEVAYLGHSAGQLDLNGYNTKIPHFDEELPIEIIRTFKNGALPYAVYKVEEGGYCFLFFQNDRYYYASYAFYVNKRLVKDDFKNITVGSPFSEVRKIDTAFDSFRCNESITSLAGIRLRWYSYEQMMKITHMNMYIIIKHFIC